MKKGDLKRGCILETAERLFFEKGYEQTAIQDILDELSLSKGGFYHHFTSKEAILGEICENRVISSLSHLKMKLSGARLGLMDRLNLLLRRVSMFERNDPAFAALLLKVCYVDGDVRIRDRMRNAVLAQIRPYVDELVADGIKSGTLYTRNPGQIPAIVLGMVDQVNDSACRILASDPENPDCIIEIAEQLNACRDAVEMLLGAPFASITLFDPAKLVSDYRAAARELQKLEGK